MIVLDTSIWIEFLKHHPDIYPEVKLLLEKNQVLAIECIFGELLQGAKNKRERDIISLYWENLPKPEQENIWIDAGLFSSENKLFSKGIGLIYTVILLTARSHNAKIWTLDKKLITLLKREEKYTS
jgi:predicted nucleic acid-binding protein